MLIAVVRVLMALLVLALLPYVLTVLAVVVYWIDDLF
jgi:hypothetical protein